MTPIRGLSLLAVALVTAVVLIGEALEAAGLSE
jgi:hypothetical protein